MPVTLPDGRKHYEVTALLMLRPRVTRVYYTYAYSSLQAERNIKHRYPHLTTQALDMWAYITQ